MKRIIFDTNILLDIFKSERKVITNYTRENLLNFIKTASNFEIVIAGSRMFNEMLGPKDILGQQVKVYDLISLLKHSTSILGSMQLIMDKTNCSEVDEEITIFTSCGSWDGNKLKNPTTDRVSGDPHIIYVMHKYNVEYLVTRDIDLAKQCNKNFNIYFKNSKKPIVFCNCVLRAPKKFNIFKAI